MRISDWSSDVCSSDLAEGRPLRAGKPRLPVRPARPPRQPIARGCDGGGRSRRLRGRPGATAVRRTEEAPVAGPAVAVTGTAVRSEEHTSELQSLMRISYAVFRLKKKTTQTRLCHAQSY